MTQKADAWEHKRRGPKFSRAFSRRKLNYKSCTKTTQNVFTVSVVRSSIVNTNILFGIHASNSYGRPRVFKSSKFLVFYWKLEVRKRISTKMTSQVWHRVENVANLRRFALTRNDALYSTVCARLPVWVASRSFYSVAENNGRIHSRRSACGRFCLLVGPSLGCNPCHDPCCRALEWTHGTNECPSSASLSPPSVNLFQGLRVFIQPGWIVEDQKVRHFRLKCCFYSHFYTTKTWFIFVFRLWNVFFSMSCFVVSKELAN